MSEARDKKSAAAKSAQMVLVALNPHSGVDVLGDHPSPLLVAGEVGKFTPTEARELLKLVNRHGVPVCLTAREK